jgi:hypothetical protein
MFYHDVCTGVYRSFITLQLYEADQRDQLDEAVRERCRSATRVSFSVCRDMPLYRL